jgi:hypothetical protein
MADIQNGICNFHGERTKQIEYLEKKIAIVCRWQSEHEKWADVSLKEQRIWQHGIEDMIHKLDVQAREKDAEQDRHVNDKFSRFEVRLSSVQSSLKSYAIAILIALVINLAATVIKG